MDIKMRITLCKEKFREIADSPRFESLILGAIFFDAVILILEFYLILNSSQMQILAQLLNLILGILIADFLIRIAAEGLYFWRYFLNTWNNIDFFILVNLLIFPDHKYIIFGRLPRLFRTSRILRGLGFVKTIIQNLKNR